MAIADEQIERILKRQSELEARLSEGGGHGDTFVKLSREYAELMPTAKIAATVRKARAECAELEEMIADGGADKEMRSLAAEERDVLEERLQGLEHDLQIALLPKDSADERSAILEIRAGTGGDEAALFAGTLLRMYQRYAEQHGWKVEPISLSETDLGGVKEAIVSISGQGVFARLKYESGVHRVQRVPETEGSGRIHTSAATVAVLPEAEEIDVVVNDNDLRIDKFRAQGAGGQHVNTTESAVRVTHLPSGIVVQQQDEKSQHKNLAKAMKILRARLYDFERERANSERAENRREQVGSGDRSERIRTYNFPQGRVTDHRINLTLYKLDRFISGEAIDEIVDALISDDQARLLADLEQAG